MNAEDRRSRPSPEPEFSWARIALPMPPWFLRWKLTWILGDIEEIERRLNDEFGLAETAPLNEEHIFLIRQRDALMRRLTDRVVEIVDA